MRISVTYKKGRSLDKIKKLQRALTARHIDVIIRKAAFVIKKRIIQSTPKRWTGQTRRSWKMQRTSGNEYSIYSEAKAVQYLEYGTKPHTARRAQRMFVPLTKRAHNAYTRGSRGRLVYGVDYVLAKKVRGVKATGFVADIRKEARTLIKVLIKRHIRMSLK